MNATAFYRVLWKEYRSQRAGWAAIATAIVFFSVVLLLDPWIVRDERTPSIFCVAIALSALYALGSSVTLFATERENGTYDFLQALPVSQWAVFFGKTAFAIGSTAVMFAFAWLLALALCGGLPDGHSDRTIWTFCGLTAVEFWAWGTLFSLVTRRTLIAASLAGTVTALFLSWLWNWDKSPAEAIGGRVAIICVVTAINLAFANRWFRERWPRYSTAASAAPARGRFSRLNLGRLGRLVWQDNRQSFAVNAAILIALLPLAANCWFAWITNMNFEHDIRSNVVYPIFTVLMLVGGLTPVMLGSTIFLGDQTGYHFRFLAERGFSPRLVWLSRQIRGLAVLLCGLLLFLPPAISLIATMRPSWHAEMWENMRVGMLEYSIWTVPVAYACGQFCSMTFRSGILAAALGGILTAVVCGWAALVSVFGMSWWWTVAPLLLAFMIATWLHAPNWMEERKGWRVWLRLSLVVAVPAVLILGAIPLVRIYEFPLVDPGFDPNEVKWPVTPEEEKARAIYLRAMQEMWKADRPDSDGNRREAEAKAIRLALEASRYPLPGFCPDDSESPGWSVLDAEWRLAELVLASGVTLQADGKLDAALDRYLAADHIALHVRQCWPFSWFALRFDIQIREQLTYWAAEPGQTSARVLKAMRALDELWHNPVMSCDDLKYWYLQVRHTLEGDPQRGLDNSYYGVSDYLAITRWLPWERVRAVRILNKLTAAQFAGCREMDAAMATGGAAPPPTFRWYRNPTRDGVTYNTVWDLVCSRPRGYLAYERYRRAAQLVLAIEAWRLDHGSLPKSLVQLEGKYVTRLPVDPYTGKPLGYEPNGFSDRVVFYICTNEPPNTPALEPGQPFVGGFRDPESEFMWARWRIETQHVSGQWDWVLPIPTSGGNPRIVPPPAQ